MAIQYQNNGGGAYGASGVTPLQVPYPSGINQNDTLILIVEDFSSTSIITTPDGWTEVAKTARIASRTGGVYIKRATGSESGNLDVTVSGSGGSNASFGIMARFTGVITSGTMYEDATLRTWGTASTTILSEEITTTGNNRLAVVAVCVADNNVLGTWSGSYAEHFDIEVNQTIDCQFVIASQLKATAGNVSQESATNSASDVYFTVTFALIPEPTNVNVGQTTETDTAQTIEVGSEDLIVGQTTETDSSQAVGKLKNIIVAQATETNTSVRIYKRIALTHPTLGIDMDDMCIWIHPTDETLSTIIASDKTAGYIFVFSLTGEIIQSLNMSALIGNVDVGYGITLSGNKYDFVAFNDRTNGNILFYIIDPDTRLLSAAGSFDDDGLTADAGNYGLCLYRSRVDGKFYVFVTSENGQINQWELIDGGSVTIDKFNDNFVRTFDMGSITEGLVCDYLTGTLYIAVEDVGVYKISAEPNGGTSPSAISSMAVGQNGIVADIEGISIYYKANGEGYIMICNQGSSNQKIFELEGSHAFVKTHTTPGISDGDGLDLSNISFGNLFPDGITTIHNGADIIYIDEWPTLGLDIDTEFYDPRDFPIFVNVGQATETDSSQAITVGTGGISVNQATETDSSQAIGKLKNISLVQSSETDSAQTISELKSISLVQSSETDSSQVIGKLKNISLVQSTETGSAQAIGGLKNIALGQASETDTAQVISATNIYFIDVNQAIETDSAQVIGKLKNNSLIQSAETDSAQVIGKLKNNSIVQSVETDSAQIISISGNTLIEVSQVIETDKAIGIGLIVNRVTETDSALNIVAAKFIIVNQATETDLALFINKNIKASQETDSALSLNIIKNKSVGQSNEIETSLSIGKVKKYNITIAIEVDSAEPVYQFGQDFIDVGQATENDIAYTIRNWNWNLLKQKNISVNILKDKIEPVIIQDKISVQIIEE